jgi:nitroreductase
MENKDLIEAIANRKSIRAFDNRNVEESTLRMLFEAARWAPSSRNEQPWSYIYAHQEDKTDFNRFLQCLNTSNQVWAKEAPVLVLSTARKNFSYKDRLNGYALHDTGAANAFLSLQATALGLQVHQMAGFDKEKTIQTFQLDPEKEIPVTFIALGYPGSIDQLSESLREQETGPRNRKALSDFVRKFEFKQN